METSFIYIITDGTAFKVGLSYSPEKRLKELQTGNPKTLSILEIFELPQDKIFKLEKQCHKQLQKKFIKHGEWFFGTAFAVRIIVDEICEPYLIDQSASGGNSSISEISKASANSS